MKRLIFLATGLAIVVAADGCAFAQSQAPPGAGKWALLVACTEYPSLDKFRQLEGPGNDVVEMREMLRSKEYGFQDKCIVVLAEGGDEKHLPTRANIEREFKELARRAQAGDQVLILLSGHGSQQPDTKPFDEIDGLDEIFLPRDIGKWDENRQTVQNAIIDDELNDWLEAICKKEALVWFIADSCHSGTLIRGLGREVEREVPADKLIPEAALQKAVIRGAAAQGGLAGAAPKAVNRGAQTQGGLAGNVNRLAGLISLSAAQPGEPTIELPLPERGSPFHGLLTFTLMKALKTALEVDKKPLTYRQLAHRIYASYLALGRSWPTPMLEGRDQDRDRFVLGRDHALNPARYQWVVRDSAGQWTVNAGALHGLTVGSILSVSPMPGDAKIDQVAGYVKVAEGGLSALNARVETCGPDGTLKSLNLPNPGECKLVYLDYGEMRVKISVDKVVGQEVTSEQKKPDELAEPERTRLRGLLRGIALQPGQKEQLIIPEDDPEKADMLLRATDTKAERVTLVPSQGWAKDRGEGLPSAFGPMAPSGAALQEQLQRIARSMNLLKIVATAAGAPRESSDDVDLKIELVRLKDKDDLQGQVVPLQPDLTLQVGDFIGFRVTNQGNVPADVTLLWVDGNYHITAVYPDPKLLGMDNRLLPAKMGGKPLLRRFEINADGLGKEHMVLIGVAPSRLQDRADFGFLAERTFDDVERQVTRGGPGGETSLNSSLGRLFQSALYARGDTTRGPSSLDMARGYNLQSVSWTSRKPKAAPGGGN
jgi:hypothetical protein